MKCPGGMSESETTSTAADLEALKQLQADASELERIEELLDRFKVFEAIGFAHQEVMHSRFLAFCFGCGRNMSTTARKYKSREYYYYVCKNSLCPNDNKCHRVADLEDKAIQILQDLSSDGTLIKQTVLEHFDIEKRRVRNPHYNIQDVTVQISELGAKRERLLDLYVEGDISKDVWQSRTDAINSQITEAENDLQRLTRTSKALEDIEHRKQNLMGLFEIGYRHDIGLTEYTPCYVDEHGNEHGTDQENYGWKETGAPTRNRIYKDLGLKVQVTREEAWVEIGGSTFCPQENCSQATPTPGSSKRAS
jgi:hypothetical protein